MINNDIEFSKTPKSKTVYSTKNFFHRDPSAQLLSDKTYIDGVKSHRFKNNNTEVTNNFKINS